jgi:hypothetical protein
VKGVQEERDELWMAGYDMVHKDQCGDCEGLWYTRIIAVKGIYM